MAESYKSAFEKACTKLIPDTQLIKKLTTYRFGFATKNEEHIEFFGGYLTGVHTVRFTNQDKDLFFEEIIGTSEYEIEEAVSEVADYKPEFKVAGDIFNLTCVYVAHVLYHAPKLSDKEKQQGMTEVFLILHYRWLTSLLFGYFKYPADKGIAEQTYNELNKRFDLKQYGSWNAYLTARAEEMASKRSIHHRTIDTFLPDEKVRYVLSDSQGRIRSVMKNIWKVFDRIHESGIKVQTTTSVAEYDGAEILKDKLHGAENYARYLESIIGDQVDFIRPELVSVIENMMPTMPPVLFSKALEFISTNYHHRGGDEIRSIVSRTLLHGFDYLQENKALLRGNMDLPGLLSNMMGVYRSARTTNPLLLNLRLDVERLVQKATHNNTKALIAAVRTGVLLYLIARAFTMNHYLRGTSVTRTQAHPR